MGLGAAAIGGIASGAGAFGSGVVSSIFGSENQADANVTNMKINQMNNEFNERMLEKQQQFNLEENQKNRDFAEKQTQGSYDFAREMFDANNAYNTFSAQRQRIEEAEYNPNLVLPSGSVASPVAGSVSSGTSTLGSGSASAASPLGVQPYRPDFSSIAGSIATGISVYNQSKQTNASVKQINEETKYIGLKAMSEAADAFANAKNSDAKAKNLQILNGLQRDLTTSEIDKNLSEVANMRETLKQLQIQTAMDRITLENYPTQLKLRFAEMAASASSLIAQGVMSRSVAEKNLAEKFMIEAKTQGIKLENYKAFQLAGDVIEQTYLVTETARKDFQNYISPRERGVWNIGAAAAAGVGAAISTRSGSKRVRSSTTRRYDPQRGWSGSETIYQY